MRILGLAVSALIVLAASAADARPWTDPGGRLTFDAPAGWTVQQRRGASPTDPFTYVIAGNANNECQFMTVPNAASAATDAATIRTISADQLHYSEQVWLTTLNNVADVFPNRSAQILSTSMDTSGFWPIARAEARSPEHAVHGALQSRPGMEIIAVCLTYGGTEPLDVYNQVIRSVGHPNDATWRAAAEAAPAPAAAPTH